MPQLMLDILAPFMCDCFMTALIPISVVDVDEFAHVDNHFAIKSKDLLHHIAFNVEQGLVMILPFNFVNGVFPKHRMREIFPRGYYFESLFNSEDVILDNKNIAVLRSTCFEDESKDDHYFTYNGKFFPIDTLIADFVDGEFRGLTFDKILLIIKNVEFSKIFTHFVFFPPC
jgi:hypothetical protein